MKRFDDLPEPRFRNMRTGTARCSLTLLVEVVTPILGGGYRLRELDAVDIIRASTIRGHLRFWWRALRGHHHNNAAELHEVEGGLWGRAAGDEGGRSDVEMQVHDLQPVAAIDDSDIDLRTTPGAYALWPARSERSTGRPPVPRRRPGTRFRLTVTAPKDRESELRATLSAWLLFGGYGSRTRRGLGTVMVIEDTTYWLPQTISRDTLKTLFGSDLLSPPSRATTDTPWLAGAAFHVGNPMKNAETAWTTALNWLTEFRQGTSADRGDRAREPGTGKPQHTRPSISNWPEADKVRRLSQARLPWAHPPRHNATPAWPRAGFGLPIVGQFQQQSRIPRPAGQKGSKNLRWNECNSPSAEPGNFELHWRSSDEAHDRLASPLIVKALPLACGSFVPGALWLNRSYPAGEVVLRGVSGSAAPFDRLVAPGDTPQFSSLQDQSSLREAFFNWLKNRHRTIEVAP